MRKLRIILAVALCAGLLFTGCTGNGDSGAGNKAVESADTEDLAEYLAENLAFEDFMNEVDEDIFFSLYNLDSGTVAEADMYSSTGATAEEVAVIRAKGGNVDAVIEACKNRIESQKEGFRDYVPKELEKLENPLLMSFGNTVVLIVSNDPEAASKLLTEYKDTEV